MASFFDFAGIKWILQWCRC